MEAIPLRSYDLDAFDAQWELTRLEMQASVAIEQEIAYLKAVVPGPEATIVDVGCGPGFMTRRIAGLVPQGRVIGVDPEPSLLAKAAMRIDENRLDNVRLVKAWADNLPIQADYADMVYARFLFQHIPEPREVLREFQRVLKPGGVVLAVDSDDGSLITFPKVPGLDRLLKASYESQALLGGDRHIGRKMRSFMIETGLQDVRIDVVPFTTEMVGFPTWVDLVIGYKAQMVDADQMSPDEVERVIRRLRELDGDPGAFGQTLVYVMSGRAR